MLPSSMDIIFLLNLVFPLYVSVSPSLPVSISVSVCVCMSAHTGVCMCVYIFHSVPVAIKGQLAVLISLLLSCVL